MENICSFYLLVLKSQASTSRKYWGVGGERCGTLQGFPGAGGSLDTVMRHDLLEWPISHLWKHTLYLLSVSPTGPPTGRAD